MMALEKTMANARHAYTFNEIMDKLKAVKLTIPQCRELRRMAERKQWEVEREANED